MKNIQGRIIYFMGIYCVMTATIFGATTEEIVTQLRNRWASIPPFKALYQQSIMTPFSPKPLIETGWLYQSGQTTRKEIQKPDRKLIIQSPDGGYQKDLTTGVVSRSADMTSQLAQWSGGNAIVNPTQMLDQFQFTIQSDTETDWILIGSYQNAKIELTVSKQWKVPIRLKMTDSATQLKLEIISTYVPIETIPMVSKMEATIQMKIGATPSEFKSVTQYSNIQLVPTMDMTLFSLENPK